MYYEQLKPEGETKLNPRGFNILILTNPIFSYFLLYLVYTQIVLRLRVIRELYTVNKLILE
jgi:hypothetical protein